MALSIPCRESFWSSRDLAITIQREMATYRQGVGDRLRALRKNRRLNQEDAAHMVGVSLTTWRNWERGLRTPYERNWAKFQQAFALTDEQVASIRGEPPTPLGLGADDAAEQLERIESKLDELLELVRPTVEQQPAEVLEAEADRLAAKRQRSDAAPKRTRRRASGT